MTKKVVVVVEQKETHDRKEVFEGEKLVVTTIGDVGNQTLEVYDGDKLIAQFYTWVYWRYTN